MTCIELIRHRASSNLTFEDHTSHNDICNTLYPVSLLFFGFGTVLFWLVIASVTATRYSSFLVFQFSFVILVTITQFRYMFVSLTQAALAITHTLGVCNSEST